MHTNGSRDGQRIYCHGRHHDDRSTDAGAWGRDGVPVHALARLVAVAEGDGVTAGSPGPRRRA